MVSITSCLISRILSPCTSVSLYVHSVFNVISDPSLSANRRALFQNLFPGVASGPAGGVSTGSPSPRTQILLLDEPTSNLDIRHQLEVTSILRELSTHRDMLVIMISHDINIAAKFSDRMILLKDGCIYAAGTPEQVITAENIREVYGVDSDIMMSDGRPHVVLKMPVGWEEQLAKLSLPPKEDDA